jgi:hypothetical protein
MIYSVESESSSAYTGAYFLARNSSLVLQSILYQEPMDYVCKEGWTLVCVLGGGGVGRPNPIPINMYLVS